MLARQKFRMYSGYQYFLVVRTIEDPDPSMLRKAVHRSPKIVMTKLLRRRTFEAIDLATLRINSGHYVFDRAIFSSRIHRLKDQKQGLAGAGVQDILLFHQQ